MPGERTKDVGEQATEGSARQLWAGVDVGSVTVKIAVVDPESRKLLHSAYLRHNARQAKTVGHALREAHTSFPDAAFRVAVCGSGGEAIAAAIGAHYVQEVVANAVAVRAHHPTTRVAIELGGQDAKVIFFHRDPATGQLIASDMRMNGSCAGGTGAFIDQMAELLEVRPEEFEALAAAGSTVYDISGRCGVFAKTDIQPLLNQCVAREDIALSVFHALAKQTIGGLVQGMPVKPPVLFEGGPLTFNPHLIEVFATRLGLSDDQVLVPERPEILVARGAALAVEALFADHPSGYDPAHLGRLDAPLGGRQSFNFYESGPFFADSADRAAFAERHPRPSFTPATHPPGSRLAVFLGIDAGSTTSKFVLLDEDEAVVDTFYAPNGGEPLRVVQRALVEMHARYRYRGVELDVLGMGTTGYGEQLFAAAFDADYHTVETVAHAAAAAKYVPDVSFILDVGGQDMKAIQIADGVVTGITLNEACSAGCGSFVETFARSLGIPVDQVAALAFDAERPSRLGSRCTVFMNSSVITEQKNGKSAADIMAGVTRSIIENLFTKVVRITNFAQLGEVVCLQGGTFLNDAVLRAFEQYTGRRAVRPPHPAEMGAIGIALLTKRAAAERAAADSAPTPSRFVGFEALERFDFAKEPAQTCPYCTNSCSRTLIRFSDGRTHVTGNRCERGEVFGDPKDPGTKAQLKAAAKKMGAVPDLLQLRHRLLMRDPKPRSVSPAKGVRIGLPRVLEFWNSLPFWRALFTSLGYEVVVSKRSDYALFEEGLGSVPSDTICFPAKLAHGHVRDLIRKKVDRIFMPMMVKIPAENDSSEGVHTCAVIQGYPVIIRESDEPSTRHGVPFEHPIFHWYNRKLRDRQLTDYLHDRDQLKKEEIRAAIAEGDRAMAAVQEELAAAGRALLAELDGTDRFAVVLAGRPYHSDTLVNHELSRHFTRLGVPVLTVDALPDLHEVDVSRVRAETVNPFHVRMYAAAIRAARHPQLEVVQLVSFGCGHDAVITDEMQRLVREIADKQLLVLKLDEGEARGPLNIRIKSFVETVRAQRRRRHDAGETAPVRELPQPFPVLFEKKDVPLRTILAPNISRAFCEIVSAVGRRHGYRVAPMPLANARAIELGKKYLHNDICFPAQINIGEFLALLETGAYRPEEVVLGLAKNCDDCRAGQYATLARKALDDAGYHNVPIMTTGVDTKGMHPGFRLGMPEQIRILWGLAIMDVIDDMVRKTRPYELEPGQTDAVFERCFRDIVVGLEQQSKFAVEALWRAIEAFNEIPVDRSVRRPRVGIIGEILLNYHPTSNGDLVGYLESHGMEVILPSMVDFFHRDVIRVLDGARRHHIPHPILDGLLATVTEQFYIHVLGKVGEVAGEFRFHEPHRDIYRLSENVDGIIDRTYMVGEGWLIPAEILEHWQHGVQAFVIVQPFGCLPNHITGRGLIKTLRQRCPGIQIVSLDYDPDTSFANVENRLQMLIMATKELARASDGGSLSQHGEASSTHPSLRG